MNLEKIKADLEQAITELVYESNLKEGSILVLGCSSSEILGERIGKHTSLEVGELVVKTVLDKLDGTGVYLAVQGCEHINRALIVESEVAMKYCFEIVNVRPVKTAGGACATAAFEMFNNPVAIEHIIADASIDIGDTSTGMHVRFVQVPVRLSVKEIGKAHVTSLKSRPKLIGGSRSQYL